MTDSEEFRLGAKSDRSTRRFFDSLDAAVQAWPHSPLSLPSAIPPEVSLHTGYVTETVLPEPFPNAGETSLSFTAWFVHPGINLSESAPEELLQAGGVTVQISVGDDDRIATVIAPRTFVTPSGDSHTFVPFEDNIIEINGRPALNNTAFKEKGSQINFRCIEWSEPTNQQGVFTYYVIGTDPFARTDDEALRIAQSMRRVK